MVREREKDELQKLKRQVRELKKEVRELSKMVEQFLREPQKAMLYALGIAYPDEEVLDGDGLGVAYVRIQKKRQEAFLKELKEEAPEIYEKVVEWIEKENPSGKKKA